MDSNRRPRRCELSSDAGQGPRAQVTRIEGQKGRGHHRGRHPQGRPLSSHSVWLSCTYYLYSFGFSKRVPHLQAQCRRCLRADDFHWRSPDPQVSGRGALCRLLHTGLWVLPALASPGTSLRALFSGSSSSVPPPVPLRSHPFPRFRPPPLPPSVSTAWHVLL